MTPRTRKVASGAVAVAAVAVVVAGVLWAVNATPADPRPAREVSTDWHKPLPTFTPTPTATPTPEPSDEPVAEEPEAPVEQAPSAPVQRPAPAPAPQPAPPAPAPPAPAPEAPAPPAPPAVKCPGGTSAIASDGYNDTACLPVVCFSIAVPDPAHPECDNPIRP